MSSLSGAEEGTIKAVSEQMKVVWCGLHFGRLIWIYFMEVF